VHRVVVSLYEHNLISKYHLRMTVVAAAKAAREAGTAAAQGETKGGQPVWSAEEGGEEGQFCFCLGLFCFNLLT
jgi:hypothetical protein